jgi:hypothetical protein
MTETWSPATTPTWGSPYTRMGALQECPVPAPGGPRPAFAAGRGAPAGTMSPTRSGKGAYGARIDYAAAAGSLLLLAITTASSAL